MNASDTTVILRRQPNGVTIVSCAKTGAKLGELPPGVFDEPAVLDPLDEQMRATTIRRQRERGEEVFAGLVLGCAVVVGVVAGLLLSWI